MQKKSRASHCCKGPSIKDVRSQGGRGFCPVRILRTRGEWGFFRRGRLHFLEQKTLDFSKFLVCPHGQGGFSQCGQGKRGGNFSRFCANVFYGRPL